MRIRFSLAGRKLQLYQYGRRILLGDNTGSRPSCCGQWGSIVLQFGFQLDFFYVVHI